MKMTTIAFIAATTWFLGTILALYSIVLADKWKWKKFEKDMREKNAKKHVDRSKQDD